MRKSFTAIVVASVGLMAASAANAACTTVHTKGTAGSKDSAMVQAWEAQLQARGWKGWIEFMGSGMKVGHAPGYKSAKITRQKCMPGEMGQVCYISAALCD